jgi:transposase
MTAATDTFSAWLAQAQIAEQRLRPDQRAVLQAAFRFRQRQGHDSYSTRLLTHFLLHCGTGLKVAQLARLVGVSRPTASRQQGMSSREAVRQAHHRMDGRPYGKLLSRYAGPLIAFLLGRPKATRADLIDFIDQTFGIRVSRIALYHFLKKFGLDHVPAASTVPATPPEAVSRPRPTVVAPVPVPPFSPGARSTRAPS